MPSDHMCLLKETSLSGAHLNTQFNMCMQDDFVTSKLVWKQSKCDMEAWNLQPLAKRSKHTALCPWHKPYIMGSGKVKVDLIKVLIKQL